jgi:hypothetical protein
MNSRPRPNWRRAVAAAARLAAIYALAVFALYLPYSIRREGVFAVSSYLVVTTTFFAIGFGILAVARRLGFIVLWALLLLVWCGRVIESSSSISHYWAITGFVPWSIIALPLYGIVLLGVRGTTLGGRTCSC